MDKNPKVKLKGVARKKHVGGRVRDARIVGVRRKPCSRGKVFTKEEIARFIEENPNLKAPIPDQSMPNLRKKRLKG